MSPQSTLTTRQLEVAQLLRSGLRHGEIAAQLGISQRQVARLAEQARHRTTASTSSHLLAILAQGRLVAPQRMAA
jgi:DNA-binding CsgD family transcriptional regulator